MTLAQQTPPPNPDTPPNATHKMSSKETRRTATAHGTTVDLNSASKEDLAALPGVGPDYAQNIIDGRPYSSKEELLRKKVVPQAVYNDIQNRITASSPAK
jgi:DNA uptake protein ComE-like DNA-binding protein